MTATQEVQLSEALIPDLQDGIVPPVCLCPWSENPYRLVSLWDMLQIHAIQFQSLLDGMSNLERCCDNRNCDEKIFGLTLGAVAHDSRQLELINVLKQIDRINYWLQVSREQGIERGANLVDITPLSPMISQLRIRVHEELEESVFFHIAPSDVRTCFGRIRKDDFTAFIIKSPEDFFGAEVVRNFASASFDISESCHCGFTKPSKPASCTSKAAANPRSPANLKSAEPRSAASWPKRNPDSDGLTQASRNDTRNRTADASLFRASYRIG
jgi:hypothetical protein